MLINQSTQSNTKISSAIKGSLRATSRYFFAILWLLFTGTILYDSLGEQSHSLIRGINLRFSTQTVLSFVFISLVFMRIVSFSYRYYHHDNKRMRFIQMLVACFILCGLFIFSEDTTSATLLWAWMSGLLVLLSRFSNESSYLAKSTLIIFISQRISDILLMVSIALMGQHQPFALPLFLCGLLIKSAQFPMNHWLINTLQAPTPVSAFLHAGIITSGGLFLIHHPEVMRDTTNTYLLLTVSFISVLYAKKRKYQCYDIKTKLIFSTMAQISYMLLQCSLGYFAGACLHLIGHSTYKSYLFLNSSQQQNFNKKNICTSSTLRHFIISLLFTLVVFLIFNQWSVTENIPILIQFFIFVAAQQCSIIILQTKTSTVVKLCLFAISLLSLGIYFFTLSFLENKIHFESFPNVNIFTQIFFGSLYYVSYAQRCLNHPFNVFSSNRIRKIAARLKHIFNINLNFKKITLCYLIVIAYALTQINNHNFLQLTSCVLALLLFGFFYHKKNHSNKPLLHQLALLSLIGLPGTVSFNFWLTLFSYFQNNIVLVFVFAFTLILINSACAIELFKVYQPSSRYFSRINLTDGVFILLFIAQIILSVSSMQA